MLLVLSIFGPIWLISCLVYHFVPILRPNRTVLFAKNVGIRQVCVDPVGSYFSIFIDLIYQFSLSITVKFQWLPTARLILPVGYRGCRVFRSLDRYLYPLGPVETRSIDYFGFSLYLLSVFLASINFLGFSLDFSLHLLSVFLQYNRNVLILY